MEIRVEIAEYLDFAAVEYVAFFTNKGSKETPVISDIKTVDVFIPCVNPRLTHSNGDDLSENGYEEISQPVECKITKTHLDGTSCKGAFPYMRIVSGDKWGINVAIGWPARWLAEIEPEGPGIRLRAGQRRCHMKIRPGEPIRTPRVTFLAYSGDESRGMNEWRRWYITHILPKENGRPFPPKLRLHVFEAEGMPEFTGANEHNQMRGLDSYIEKNLTPDIWWIDAGWYPCKGEWHKTGTWKIDSERFPRGLLPIGEKCAEHNTRFLLWFEPERVFENSDIAKKHP